MDFSLMISYDLLYTCEQVNVFDDDANLIKSIPFV